jgi:hypothetical protein
MRVTVNLTDIEDSYLSNTMIKGVYLTVEHDDLVGQSGDPWGNDSRWNTSFTNLKTATQNGNGIETWNTTLSLPLLTEFYSGHCILKIHMIDDDDDVGVSDGYYFYVNNSAPNIISPNVKIEIAGVAGATVVEEGTDIKVWVYYEDVDYVSSNPNNELGLSGISIDYSILYGAQLRTAHVVFARGEWEVDAGTGALIVAIDTSEENTALQINTRETISIQITKVTIYDNDNEHVLHDQITGSTSDFVSLNYNIEFVPGQKVIPWWVWLIVAVAAAAGGVFFVWYYKKYFSYKRYMD